MGFLSFLRAPALFVSATFATLVAGVALKNITIAVPEGTTNHGNPNLLCTPARWTDVIVFYLGNYVAHAATVITLPGESRISVILVVTSALLFPASGVLRGAFAIMSFAKFAKGDLHIAARAGALCMVVRTKEWRPQNGDSFPQVVLKLGEDQSRANTELSNETADIEIFHNPHNEINRKVHGSSDLPIGYKLTLVPANAKFSTDEAAETASISCSYNAVQILIALGQSLYAAATLYWSRGDQITQYGYAAFGLTVAPYAVMSVVNLLGNMITPQYPAVYLVESSIMKEAQKRRGCYIDGVVGKLAEESTAELESKNENFRLAKFLTFEENDIAGKLDVRFQQPTAQSLELSPSRLEDWPVITDQTTVELASQDEKQTLLVHEEGNPDSQSGNKARPTLFIPSEPFLSYYPRSSLVKPKIKIGSKNKEDSVFLTPDEWEESQLGYMILFSFPIIVIQIAIIGGISRFQEGASTVAQRVWTMVWFSLGIPFGYFLYLGFGELDKKERKDYLIGLTLFFLFFCPPAIGGYIVVGQMLLAFGNCILLQ